MDAACAHVTVGNASSSRHVFPPSTGSCRCASAGRPFFLSYALVNHRPSYSIRWHGKNPYSSTSSISPLVSTLLLFCSLRVKEPQFQKSYVHRLHVVNLSSFIGISSKQVLLSPDLSLFRVTSIQQLRAPTPFPCFSGLRPFEEFLPLPLFPQNLCFPKTPAQLMDIQKKMYLR